MDLKGHIATSLFAAWRFLFEGEQVLKYLDASAKGVFRSFFALFFTLPVFFLLIWLQFHGPGFQWVTPWHILALFTGYGLSWALFAFLIFHAQGVVGPRQNFMVFLPLYNWGRFFCLLFLVPFALLERFGLIEGSIKMALFALLMAGVLVYKLAITRAALGVNLFHGLVFILFDVLLMALFAALILQAFAAFQ